MSASPETLFTKLRSKARSGILVEGFGLGLGALVVFMAVTFPIDRTLHLETEYRACLLALFLLVLWNLLRKRVLRPMRFELTDDELALAMERGEDLRQSLISAVQFERVVAAGNPGQESVELMQMVIRDVQGRVPGLRDSAALDLGRVRRFAALILGCVAVVGTWAVVHHASLAQWARRNLLMMNEDWPRASVLEFVMDDRDGVVRVPEGNDLTIEVQATGVVPDQVFIRYEFPDGTTGREPMRLAGDAAAGAPGSPAAGGKPQGPEGRFSWTLESVISDAVLYAEGGDALRKTLRVQMVERPELRDLVIEKSYPEYMRKEPEQVKSSEGDVRLPAGVSLKISGRSSKELKDAYLTFDQQAKTDLQLDPANAAFSGSFVPTKSGVLTVDVTDRDGLGAHRPPKIFLRIVPDTAPIVDFKTMGIGSMIVYKAVIPGLLKIRDDYGITGVVSKIRLSGGMSDEGKPLEDAPWETVPFQDMRQPDPKENEDLYEERVSFDLLSKNDQSIGPDDPRNPIRPGMLLAISFEASDNFGPGERQVGRNETLTLRIVEEEKLMQDLHRRQLERRRELTQILEKERYHHGELQRLDPKAPGTQGALRTLSSEQLAMQKQLIGVAQRYAQILDEYFNNRILKPNQVTEQRQVIQFPLEKLSKEDFPNSAQEVAAFAERGLEDQRTVAVASYSAIIRVLEDVVSHMRHLESIAGILEDVKRIRDLEHRVEGDARKSLDAEDKGAEKVDRPKKGDKPGEPGKDGKPGEKPTEKPTEKPRGPDRSKGKSGKSGGNGRSPAPAPAPVARGPGRVDHPRERSGFATATGEHGAPGGVKPVSQPGLAASTAVETTTLAGRYHGPSATRREPADR